MKKEIAKPEMFANVFSGNRLASIEKISLDSQSMKPTFAQEPVPPRQRSAAPKRVSQVSVFAITSGKEEWVKPTSLPTLLRHWRCVRNE